MLVNKDLKILYVSDRHNQINEVDVTLNTDEFIHWYGIDQICPRKSNQYVKFLIDNKLPTSVICRDCQFKKNCMYLAQFKLEDFKVVAAPKEFLPSRYIQDNKWDIIIIDEIIDKTNPIKPYVGNIDRKLFESFGIIDLYPFYTFIKTAIESKDIEGIGESIEDLKDYAIYIRGKIIPEVVKQIKKDNLLKSKDIGEFLQFLNKFSETIEYLECCIKYGFKPHFSTPYLYYVFNLREKYGSNVIILNTSLKMEVLDLLVTNYNKSIPEPLVFDFPIENKNSFLLHYNFKGRSCSKGALFELDEKYRIKQDENGYPLFNEKKYGKEVLMIIFDIINYFKKNNLKVGVITFKRAIKLFEDKVDVISYFGGHQGSNAFDDVDILIIMGTFNINPNGIYNKHYSITKEFLGENKALWNKRVKINGMQMNFSDNDELNLIKEYKLHEEHGQAIFRSGAHVKDGKIVISFGFVPKGVENLLNYSSVKTAIGIKTSVGRRLESLNK